MKNNILPLLGLSILLFSCSQLDNTEENEQISYDQKLIENKDIVQKFSITSDRDTIITGEKGTVIYFPKNCLTSNNELVSIKLKECYNISDMLFNGLTTSTMNIPIETDGMIFIDAVTSSGKKITKLIKPIHVKMPSKNSGMSLFYGNTSTKNINWEQDTLNLYLDTVPLNTLYNEFQFTTLGWINADRLLHIKDKRDLLVIIPNMHKGVSCSVVLHNSNAILPASTTNENKIYFKNIPSDQKVTIIALGISNGEYYYQSMDVEKDINSVKLNNIIKSSKDKIQEEFTKKFGEVLARR